MSITAVDGKVRWEMSPNRARKVAALLRAYTRAFSEATRLDTAATEADRARLLTIIDRLVPVSASVDPEGGP